MKEKVFERTGLNLQSLEELPSVSEFLFGERHKSRAPVSKNIGALTFLLRPDEQIGMKARLARQNVH